MILAGDVGGTKARIALYRHNDGRPVRGMVKQFWCRDFGGVTEIVSEFLRECSAPIERACLGVPGAVTGGEVHLVNLDWSVSERSLTDAMRGVPVKLVNDLVATAAAVPHLSSEQLAVLHQGTAPQAKGATVAVLAPGTGLGHAFLTWEGGKPTAHPSEGGHADFSPTTSLELALCGYLLKKFGRVSYERVATGPGLVNIYEFLRDRDPDAEPEDFRERLAREEDAAAAIATAGQNREVELCEKALDLFAAILGSRAANVALSLLATGGVYIGGGIPPKIAGKLADGTLVRAYLNKGRVSWLVQATPLYLIKDDTAALLGAAHLAMAS